jgi:hypothetical protein
MIRGRLLGLVALFAMGGCVRDRNAEDRFPADSSGASAAPARADSLVLTSPSGVEVWFSASRAAEDSAGRPCTERAMEVRRAGRRIPIPLLYTGGVPRLVNDSTIEAAIWLHCRPGNLYHVSLTSGLPVRVR